MNRSELSPIEAGVKKQLDRVFGGREDLRLLMGVSGGPDSMALWHIFHRLQVDGIVCHVNYQKRGEESEKDAEMVTEMAEQWGYPAEVVRVDPARAEDHNFQQWARDRRYEIFRTVMDRESTEGIAVAHHQDDQVETILLKMFRGAGLEAWEGMQVWDGELFRPLLGVGRREIENYLGEWEVPYRIDESNLSSNYARNFLRNEWLESLESHFPGWKRNILRLSGQAKLFGKALDEILEGLIDDRDRIDREKFLQLDPVLRRSVLLHYLKRIDPAVSVSADALSQLNEIGNLQTGRELQLTERFSLMRDRDGYKVVYDRPDSLEIALLERGDLAGGGFRIDDLVIRVKPMETTAIQEVLALDADRIAWPVKLRYWQDGDRFQPLGMSGHQNVSNHLTNRKIGAAEKQKSMVLESFEEKICAVIFPPIEKRVPPGTISEEFRCKEDTGKCLTVEWKDRGT